MEELVAGWLNPIYSEDSNTHSHRQLEEEAAEVIAYGIPCGERLC